jgi:hypothetical protein
MKNVSFVKKFDAKNEEISNIQQGSTAAVEGFLMLFFLSGTSRVNICENWLPH